MRVGKLFFQGHLLVFEIDAGLLDVKVLLRQTQPLGLELSDLHLDHRLRSLSLLVDRRNVVPDMLQLLVQSFDVRPLVSVLKHASRKEGEEGEKEDERLCARVESVGKREPGRRPKLVGERQVGLSLGCGTRSRSRSVTREMERERRGWWGRT